MRTEHLYIHVPFCARRCVYCDFSIAVRSRPPVDEYLQALEAEWATRHAQSEFDLRTLYLGGGTPSKLGGEGVAKLLDTVRRHAALRGDAEVTLEANPEDVSHQTARAWCSAGVNRVSLGVQSFDDDVLRWMHRTHDANAARNAVQVLHEAGFANISIDLIFALPVEVSRSWGSDLDTVLALDVSHLSIYGLTVEEHTPLGRWVARRDLSEAPEQCFEREFLEADAKLRAAGFEHYEVSNYARRNQESRHNRAYWRRSPYGGLGPSAHEFDGRVRRWNAEAYVRWLSELERGADPLGGAEELLLEQEVAEHVYLSLRTNDGLAVSTREKEHAKRWIDAGWGTIGDDSRLRLSSLGWLRLDYLANDLTMLRSRY